MKKNTNYINIYGDSIINLKIFINNIMEYHKERYYLYNFKEEKTKIEHIILNDENSENIEDEIHYKYFYYIYIDDTKFIEFIKNKFTKLKYKIILFSKDELKKDDINAGYFKIKIKINPEFSEQEDDNEYIPNYYIKFQDKYSVRNIWKLVKKKKEF